MLFCISITAQKHNLQTSRRSIAIAFTDKRLRALLRRHAPYRLIIADFAFSPPFRLGCNRICIDSSLCTIEPNIFHTEETAIRTKRKSDDFVNNDSKCILNFQLMREDDRIIVSITLLEGEKDPH